ncbi:MAG TPA: ROK family transcriptional regulator [Hydrogenispora sp.]|nr:ROK family transcriptional regulator [Hydrogenispora sp.]
MDYLRRGNKTLIKDLNRALVLYHLRRHGPLSQAEIAQQTKLSPSTLSKITEELKERKMIKEVGEGPSKGGRKPVFLEFNYDYGYAIGIKIEVKRVTIVLTDLKAQILDKNEMKFDYGTSSDEVIALIIEGITELTARNKGEDRHWLGVGIGVSGLVNKQKGELIYSRLLGWNRVPFRKILQEKFSVPVYVDNDVNVYTLAELTYGYGQDLNNFILVISGVGIGAGFVFNRQIYRGEFGGAGEVGHMVIFPEGKNCYCGRQGCLEAHAGEKYIIEETKRLLSADKDSPLYAERSSLTIERVLAAAEQGDHHARKALYTAGRNLGIGLVNLINIVNPAAIILSGENINGIEYMKPGLDEVINENFFNQYCKAFDIRISELGEDAWVIGAATLVINQQFQAPILRKEKTVLTSPH